MWETVIWGYFIAPIKDGDFCRYLLGLDHILAIFMVENEDSPANLVSSFQSKPRLEPWMGLYRFHYQVTSLGNEEDALIK